MEPWRPILRDANARMSAELRDAGSSIWSADIGDRRLDVLELTVGLDPDPPEYVADAFGTGDVLLRDRVYAVDGRRVQRALTWLPASLVAGSRICDADTGPGGVPARLAELGFALVHFVEEPQFMLPSETNQVKLRIGPDEPVVVIDRSSTTDAGQTVEISEMTLVNREYRFRWSWTNC